MTWKDRLSLQINETAGFRIVWEIGSFGAGSFPFSAFRSFIRSPFDSYGDRSSLSESERDQLIFLAVIAESFSSIFFFSNLQRNIASVSPSNTKAKETFALRFLFPLLQICVPH